MNKVYVVMTNDYPDCVFDEQWKAEVYVELNRQWQKRDDVSGPGVYYRSYEFSLNEPGRLMAYRDRHYNLREPTQKEREEFSASLRAAWEERQR